APRETENMASRGSAPGIAIAEDQLPLIFDAFKQADGTASRRYGGTGLGLSISRDIARVLGGEIRVDSLPGHGSTFTLYLPVRYLPPASDGGKAMGPVSQQDAQDAMDALAA